jgi:hypothetical protein
VSRLQPSPDGVSAAETHALADSSSWPNEPNTYLSFAKPMAKKIYRAVHDDEQSGIFIAFRMDPRSRWTTNQLSIVHEQGGERKGVRCEPFSAFQNPTRIQRSHAQL